MKTRAYVYCRVAQDDTQLPALKLQSKQLMNYIAEHGLKLAGQTQAVEPACTLDRASLRDLLREAIEGAYDILLVPSLDRICRNTFLLSRYCYNLLLCGVRIVSVQEGREVTMEELNRYGGLR